MTTNQDGNIETEKSAAKESSKATQPKASSAAEAGYQNMRDFFVEENGKHFYDFVYTPFSAAVHNMWHHVARYNLTYCDNPLHRYHRIPIDPPDCFYRD